MADEVKDAMRYKQLLARKLMLVSGHQVVSSENSCFNNPDIISLTRSDMLIEYEIKIARSDLMGELNSVRACENMLLMRTHNEHLQGSQQMELGGKTINVHFRGNILEPEGLHTDIGKCSKLDKHETYLIPKPSERNAFGEFEQPYRPNQFYFAVTSDLVSLAEEVCKFTPYGVINLDALNGSSSVVKKAGFIHRQEASRENIAQMARALSFAKWA